MVVSAPAVINNLGAVGGQGGCVLQSASYANVDKWLRSKAGDGGQAGAGGFITVSPSAIIFAYNGGVGTDDEGGSSFVWSCNLTEAGCTESVKKGEMNLILRCDGAQLYPCFIFAQSGIIRETYATNQNEIELSKIKVQDSTVTLTEHEYDAENFLATFAEKTTVTNYSNRGFRKSRYRIWCWLFRIR